MLGQLAPVFWAGRTDATGYLAPTLGQLAPLRALDASHRCPWATRTYSQPKGNRFTAALRLLTLQGT